jgi:probable selenium-dependent hydroxylase accessory protein YqeC
MYKEAFEIGDKEVISIVGAGGKTTLMYSLAKNLNMENKKVITTTTTKILPPSLEETEHLLISDNDEEIIEFVRSGRYRHVTIAKEHLPSGKLDGIDENLIKKLKDLVDYIIIEADGAARRPLKVPGPHEPVIPSITTIVIPVAGIDALGLKLSNENVFRAEIASKLTGSPLGSEVTYEIMAILIFNMAKDVPADSRIIPFINKIDIDEGREKGRRLGRELIKLGYKRVILGQAKDLNNIEVLN